MTHLTVEKVNEVYIRVYSHDMGIEQELGDFFTYEFPGARFTPQYRAKLWDGKVRLYDIIRKTLYSGLLEYVEKFCEQNGYLLTYKDNIRNEAGITINEVEEYAKWLNPHGHGKPIEIRDYQLDAVHTALNKERSLLLSPTASGKSFIIYTTMRWHLEKGRKCIIVVPTTSLVEQLFSDFEDYSSENGWCTDYHCQKLYSGFSKDFNKDVLITTWQSIYQQPKAWFSQFNVIFGDEAHQFKAKSLTTVMERLTDVKYRIGTTGTIDNKKVHRLVLEGIFGPLHRVITTKELMDSGRVANLNITCLLMKYDDITRQGRKNNQYQDEIDFLVTNENRIMEGKDDAIIIASFGTFSTGINIPSIENVIFASPSKSKIRNLQSIGRGLRLKDGKTHCNLYDIADDLSWKSWKNHTLHHFAERVKTYSEEKFTYKIVEVKV